MYVVRCVACHNNNNNNEIIKSIIICGFIIAESSRININNLYPVCFVRATDFWDRWQWKASDLHDNSNSRIYMDSGAHLRNTGISGLKCEGKIVSDVLFPFMFIIITDSSWYTVDSARTRKTLRCSECVCGCHLHALIKRRRRTIFQMNALMIFTCTVSANNFFLSLFISFLSFVFSFFSTWFLCKSVAITINGWPFPNVCLAGTEIPHKQ